MQVESTGVVYQGDFSSKFKFFFDSESLEFSFVEAENEVFIADNAFNEVSECYEVQYSMSIGNV